MFKAYVLKIAAVAGVAGLLAAMPSANATPTLAPILVAGGGHSIGGGGSGSFHGGSVRVFGNHHVNDYGYGGFSGRFDGPYNTPCDNHSNPYYRCY